MSTSPKGNSREENVTNILLRLPVKSLLRFKCVCKNWTDLIKSSSFIKKHYDNERVRFRLMICKFGVDYRPQPPLRAVTFFLLPETLLPGVVPANKKFYRNEDVSDFWKIYGPINGIFLLEKGSFLCNVRFAWWNPARKECRLIPFYNFELQRFFDESERTLAIGFDEVSQDYKLLSLRIYTNTEKREIYPKVFAAIYSSNNDSWKLLEEPNFPYDYNICEPLDCTHINGIYYWLCIKDSAYTIWTFDFTTELLKGIDEAPDIPGDHWAALMMRGGSLAAMSCSELTEPDTETYEVWTRIGEKNWIKVFTIIPGIRWYSALGIWGYDKLIYEMPQTYNIVYYDHTSKKVTDFGFNFANISSGSVWPLSYKESLVPIKRANPNEEDDVDYFFSQF